MINFSLIKTRLAISFAAVGILLCVSNIASIASVNAIHDKFESTNERIIPGIQSASNIADELSSVRRFELGLLIYKLDGSNDKVGKFKNEIPDRIAKVDSSILNYKLAMGENGEEGSVLKSLDMHWAQYKKNMQDIQLSALGDSGNFSATSVFGESLDIYNQLIASVNKLMMINNNYAKNNSSKAYEQYIVLVRIITFILIASVSLSVFFSLSLQKKIVKPLSLLIEQSKKIAAGDLSNDSFISEYFCCDELGVLANSMTMMKDSLRELLHEITTSVSQLSSAAEYVNSIAEQSAHEMFQQQNEISMLASAINEMQSSASEVSCNTNNAANAANEACRISVNGRDDVYASINNIEDIANEIEIASENTQQLTAKSENIGVVLDVIRDIADQTNLLALNAAIEAARAGDQGRGFAVVADEVRTLAQRTQASTDEINKIIEVLQLQANESGKLINTSRNKMNDGVELARQTGFTIDGVNRSISIISDMNIQIAAATEEQRAVAESLNKTIVNINNSSGEIASGASETVNACSELLRLSTKLQSLSNRFVF